MAETKDTKSKGFCCGICGDEDKKEEVFVDLDKKDPEPPKLSSLPPPENVPVRTSVQPKIVFNYRTPSTIERTKIWFLSSLSSLKINIMNSLSFL